MSKQYKVGTHIDLRKKDEYETFTKISNAVFPYVVGVLATYGFLDLLLRSHGL